MKTCPKVEAGVYIKNGTDNNSTILINMEKKSKKQIAKEKREQEQKQLNKFYLILNDTLRVLDKKKAA